MKRRGPWTLSEPLGQGGMGVVWRATHSDGSQAALKLIATREGGTLDDGTAERFRMEIEAMRRVSHPGVVRILDQGHHEGVPWYAMELIPGDTMSQALHTAQEGTAATVALPGKHDKLDTIIDTIAGALFDELHDEASLPLAHNTGDSPVYESGAWQDALSEAKEQSAVLFRPSISLGVVEDELDLEAERPDASSPQTMQALGWLGQVCETLTYLHGEGWVHRDLKPDNVMVRPDGRALLFDFGLASRFGGRLGQDALRDAGLRVGTLSYIAPEQIDGRLVDARADLYSVGCILYEILTGRPPFEASSPLALMMKHSVSPHVPVSNLARNVPEGLSELVDGLLAKQPGERPGSGAIVAQALRRAGVEITPWADAPPSRAHLYTTGFAGRESELATLEALRKSTQRGMGAVAWIGGESGAGKTRLALEIAKRSRQRAAVVLTGQCSQIDASLVQNTFAAPMHALLGPLRVIADACAQQGEPYTRRVFAQDRAARLTPFAPFLRHLPGVTLSGFATLTGAAARARIKSSAREVFEAFTGTQPAAFVLEDLQWADELSLEILAELVDRSATSRQWMLLCTYRSEEVHPKLSELLDTRRDNQERLDLTALSDSAVGRIVSGMLGVHEADPVLGSFVARRSAGNPFFAGEYLRLLVDEGLLRRDQRGAWTLNQAYSNTRARLDSLPAPGSMVALATARLARLDEAPRVLAAAVALVGKRATISMAAELAELEPHLVASSVYELERARILEADGIELQFTHDKLREAAYAIIPPGSRAELHARAASLILDSSHAELARHLDMAGDYESAHARYLEASKAAADKNAMRAAERYARRALAISSPDSSEDILARLALSKPILLAESRFEEVIELLEGREEVAARVSSLYARMTLATDLGEALRLVGRGEEAMALLERARDLFIAHPKELNGGSRVLNSLAIVYQAVAMLDEAVACHHLGLSMREHIDPTIAAGMLANLGVVERRRGNLDEARRCYEEAIALNEELGNHRSAAIALGNLSTLFLCTGRVQDAVSCAERALIARRVSGDVRGAVHNLRVLSGALIAAGQIERAREYIEEALAQVELVSSLRHRANAHRGLGEVLIAEGRFVDAVRSLDQSVELARACGDTNMRALVLLIRASAYVDAGDIESAHADLHEAIDFAGDEARLLGFYDLVLARIYLAQGAPRDAIERCHGALEHFAAGKRVLDQLETYTVLLRALVDAGQDTHATLELADRLHDQLKEQAPIASQRYRATRPFIRTR